MSEKVCESESLSAPFAGVRKNSSHLHSSFASAPYSFALSAPYQRYLSLRTIDPTFRRSYHGFVTCIANPGEVIHIVGLVSRASPSACGSQSECHLSKI